MYFRPKEKVEVNKIHVPQPIKHIRKSDFTHTWKGTIAGLIIMGAAVINLVLFFGFDGKIPPKSFIPLHFNDIFFRKRNYER